MKLIYLSSTLVLMVALISGCITSRGETYRITAKQESDHSIVLATEIAERILENQKILSDIDKKADQILLVPPSYFDFKSYDSPVEVEIEECSQTQSIIKLTEWHATEDSKFLKAARTDLESELLTHTNKYVIHKYNGWWWKPLK